MDALKIMTEGMLKEERPNINIGDVVKVHVKIREGEREKEFRFSKVQLLLARAAVFRRPLQFVVFLTA